MGVERDIANETVSADRIENVDLNFLPGNLTKQCRSLIESYHGVHGYACLPDILWKSRLGPFIRSTANCANSCARHQRREAQKRPMTDLSVSRLRF